MGRKPLPTAIKELKGTLRKCRTNPLEPKPTGEIGDPPDYMSDRAKEIWWQVVRYLPKGVICASDTGVLETYCNFSAQREKLQAAVDKDGATVSPTEISAIFNALVKCEQILAKAGSELGLTPAARQKVAQGYGDASNPDTDTLDLFGDLDRHACANA